MTTRAGNAAAAEASRMAWRFEPRPEARTATGSGWFTRRTAQGGRDVVGGEARLGERGRNDGNRRLGLALHRHRVARAVHLGMPGKLELAGDEEASQPIALDG